MPSSGGAFAKVSARRVDRSAPTGVNYGFPMAVLAMLLAEPKASQSLPALEAPISNRQCRRPRGGGPEVFLVVQVAVTWPAFIAGRSLKRATANRAPGRHPMPCTCSRHPLSTRSTQRAVVFALMGSPLAPAHRLDTALDFRSGADPCEWMALRLQNRSTSWREA